MPERTVLQFGRQDALQRQSSSLLFTVLPPEIRLKIYEYYEVVIKRDVALLADTYHDLNADHATPSLLLTCRMAYIEARPEIFRSLWFTPIIDYFTWAFQWEISSSHRFAPRNARQIVVSYKVLDRGMPQADQYMEFTKATTLQIEWKKRPTKLLEELVDHHMYDRNLATMMEQCFYFIDKMPCLKRVHLTGFYWDELPEKIMSRIALQVKNRERTHGLTVFTYPDRIVQGGLNDLVRIWNSVLTALTEHYKLALREPEQLLSSSDGFACVGEWEETVIEIAARWRYKLPLEELETLRGLAKAARWID
ncbi:hypothetical protein F4810DRAFT_725978 [Camillea tinctor]|nr:hypothetical protein F4810DRAFT_725978 [Camillea tinctor]